MADRPDEIPGEEVEHSGPTVHDRRRIDPLTGAVRQLRGQSGVAPAATSVGTAVGAVPGGAGSATLPGAGETVSQARVAELEASLAERTADLQRLQAEYVNYRRRVERDRDAAREQAIAGVLGDLLPVLDDIHLARQHGDLEGPFRAVAEALEATVGKLGLQRYGEAGEPFDPVVHEALMHSYDDSLSEATCMQVLQPGYRLGDGEGARVLRPARVAVAEPGE